ncbi:Ig-like domain-containing protein [Clostridium sporogenes]|uniref:Ig-like domain-containing protein n=1 Tax=Clostridium sporogenes TaxID=1509 RepID=UPI00313B2B52
MIELHAQSIEALNLNQVKIVFASKVDEDAAKDVTNYEVGGKQLNKNIARAVLKDDDRTVVLTLAEKQEQHDEVTVKVRKGVLTEDKTKNVKEYEKDVIFKDLVAPKVEKVSVRGNSKITVEFSEAIYIDNAKDDVDAAKKLAEKFEINGQSIYSMGLDNEYTKVKDSLQLKDKSYYVNKVDFYFTSPLDSGTNELKVLDGERDYILSDAAGFIVKEANFDFKVEEVTSKPKVKSVKGGTDGKIYIDFDRAMDLDTAQVAKNYKLNDKSLEGKAEVELKKDDTQVKITVDSGLVKTGSNVIEVLDKVKDAYGNKVDDDTRISFTAEKDDVKPKVASVTSIDANTIRVRFTEDVRYNHAVNKSNYELKDSNGTNITDEYFETDAISAANGKKDKDTDVYDIKLKKELTSKKYTLKIENIADTSDNVMDDYTATFNGEDDEAPFVEKAVKKVTKSEKDATKVTKVEVVIQFSEEMDRASLRKSENYRYIEENKVKDLPSKTTISVASDNKTVTLEFPVSYNEKLTGIIVKSEVKDLAGNTMEADYRESKLSDNESLGLELKANSFKFNEPSDDDAEVELEFTGAVESVDKNKFTFKDSETKETVKAVNPRISGEKITFKFSGDDAKKIKTFGSHLAVSFEKGAVIDKAGGDVKGLDEFVKVYNNNVKPRLDVETEGQYVTNWKATENSVTIKFNTKLSKKSKDSYDNDFEFRNLGNSEKLKVDSVTVEGAEITYKFTDSINNVEEINVVAKKDNIDIRTIEDEAGDDIKYVPTDKDISGRKFKVKSAMEKNEEDKKAAEKAFNDEVAKYKESEYTSESWTKFKGVVDKETAKVKAKEATSVSINASKGQVEEAARELVTKVEAAKQALNQAITDAKKEETIKDKKKSSVDTLNAAVKEAEALTEEDKKDIAKVKAATKKITDAIGALEDKEEAATPTGLAVETTDDITLTITATGLRDDAEVTQIGLTLAESDGIKVENDKITVKLAEAATDKEEGKVTVAVKATDTHKAGKFIFNLKRTGENTWTFEKVNE